LRPPERKRSGSLFCNQQPLWRGLGSKFMVETDADDVVVEDRVDLDGDRPAEGDSRRHRAVRLPQLKVQVLDLPVPISAELAFDTGTENPAGARPAEIERRGDNTVCDDAALIDFAVSQTAGRVQQSRRSHQPANARPN